METYFQTLRTFFCSRRLRRRRPTSWNASLYAVGVHDRRPLGQGGSRGQYSNAPCLFSALTKQVIGDAQGDGVDFIYNTPNQDVLPGYLKLGWRHVNRIQPLVKVPNYPASAMCLMRSRLGNRAFIIQKKFTVQRMVAPKPCMTGCLLKRGIMMTKLSSEYTIRSYVAPDQDQVLEVMRRSLGETATLQRSPAFWQWKHFSNPFGPSYVRVACGEDGQVVGMRAFLRWEFMTRDRLVKAVRAVDTVTHPGYRRIGIFSRLTKEVIGDVQGDGVDLIFNTPNQDVLPGYLKLGWRHVNKVHPLIKVLNYPVFALGLMRSRLGKAASRRHLPAEFFREEPLPVGALLERHQPVEMLIQQDAESWDAQNRMRTRRSWDYFYWRYASHPTISYWTVFVEHDGNLRGCVIFRTNTRYGLKEVIICELLAEPDMELGFALLEQLKSGLQADYLISHFPRGSFQRQTLEQWGFHATPKQGVDFTVKVLDTNLPQDPLLFDSWGLTLGDLDVL